MTCKTRIDGEKVTFQLNGFMSNEYGENDVNGQYFNNDSTLYNANLNDDNSVTIRFFEEGGFPPKKRRAKKVTKITSEQMTQEFIPQYETEKAYAIVVADNGKITQNKEYVQFIAKSISKCENGRYFAPSWAVPTSHIFYYSIQNFKEV